jgi:uncharacterized caspase-like protein
VKASALSVADLQRELAGLAAHGRVLVLLDACHSGASTGEGVSRGADATALRTSLEAANITVLTSSRGREISREDAAVRHGYFTKALLDAFGRSGCGHQQRSFHHCKRLGEYLDRRVPVLSHDTQHPEMTVRFGGSLFASTHS